MKRLALLGVLILSFACAAVADQINFNFTVGSPGSVKATMASGLTSGPSTLTSISDSSTGVINPTLGQYVNGNTGPAISLVHLGTQVIATFSAGGVNSVLVEDASHTVLVRGDMETDSSLLSTVPVGTGSFLGVFHVTFVNPAALALFGLGPNFLPDGSVSFTFGNASFDGTTFTAALGGGSVTIQTPTTVPEPAGLGVLGMGLLAVAGGLKRWRTTHNSLSQ
jgi:hypothetical protein